MLDSVAGIEPWVNPARASAPSGPPPPPAESSGVLPLPKQPGPDRKGPSMPLMGSRGDGEWELGCTGLPTVVVVVEVEEVEVYNGSER